MATKKINDEEHLNRRRFQVRPKAKADFAEDEISTLKYLVQYPRIFNSNIQRRADIDAESPPSPGYRIAGSMDDMKPLHCCHPSCFIQRFVDAKIARNEEIKAWEVAPDGEQHLLQLHTPGLSKFPGSAKSLRMQKIDAEGSSTMPASC